LCSNFHILLALFLVVLFLFNEDKGDGDVVDGGGGDMMMMMVVVVMMMMMMVVVVMMMMVVVVVVVLMMMDTITMVMLLLMTTSMMALFSLVKFDFMNEKKEKKYPKQACEDQPRRTRSCVLLLLSSPHPIDFFFYC